MLCIYAYFIPNHDQPILNIIRIHSTFFRCLLHLNVCNGYLHILWETIHLLSPILLNIIKARFYTYVFFNLWTGVIKIRNWIGSSLIVFVLDIVAIKLFHSFLMYTKSCKDALGLFHYTVTYIFNLSLFCCCRYVILIISFNENGR